MVKKNAIFVYCLVLCLILTKTAEAQIDTVIMKQGDVITGELISLEHGVLLIKSGYSENEFSLKWSEVMALKTTLQFKLSVFKNRQYTGKLRMDSTANSIVSVISTDTTIKISRHDIIKIEEYDKPLSRRLKLDIDLGFIKTKSNNSEQVNLDLSMEYKTQRWIFDIAYSAYVTTVDTISNDRGDLSLSSQYKFRENWFLLTKISSFKSTEQQVDFRVNYFLGTGLYIVQRNDINFYGYLGGTYNREKFTVSPDKFKTSEAFGGIHLEASPIPKLCVLTDYIAYAGLSESGRWRNYFKTDVMLSFYRHFKLGIGYILNTDSKPPVNSGRSDYLFNFKLGWSL